MRMVRISGGNDERKEQRGGSLFIEKVLSFVTAPFYMLDNNLEEQGVVDSVLGKGWKCQTLQVKIAEQHSSCHVSYAEVLQLNAIGKITLAPVPD